MEVSNRRVNFVLLARCGWLIVFGSLLAKLTRIHWKLDMDLKRPWQAESMGLCTYL